jgi:hypothetical protein
LLLEPQRTNLLTYSEQFDNAAWTKSNSSITANAATSPDGYTNADKIVENTATSGHSTFQSISVTSGATYTISAFGKAAERTRLWLDLYGGTNSANFDLSNGTILASSVGITAKIENYGNGWYRCSITGVAPAATIYPNVGPTTSSTTTNLYTGDGTSGILIYGFQAELGAYATSYIPTLGSSVTRGADACSKTGISSLIGQTEGTLFLDFDYNQPSPDANGRLLQVYGTNDTTDAILPLILGFGSDVNEFQLTVFSAAAPSVVIPASASTVVPFGRQKFAIAYNAGVYTVYRNGSLFASGSGLAPVSLTAMDLGSSSFFARNLGNPINQALLFKTRLTNQELQDLTTL